MTKHDRGVTTHRAARTICGMTGWVAAVEQYRASGKIDAFGVIDVTPPDVLL